MNDSRAVVLAGPRKLEVRAFPSPVASDDDGLLAVELAGICGTDYAMYSGALKSPYPIVLGHEIFGHVRKIGAAASSRWGVDAGDRVVVEAGVPCWSCRYCHAGLYRFCPDELHYGTATTSDLPPHLWGAMATDMYLAPRAIVHRISNAVSPAAAVLASSVVANAIRWAVDVGGAGPGKSVVVRGAGSQGLACAALAVHAGADVVILLGRATDRDRLAVAKQLGIIHRYEVDDICVPEVVRELTSPDGADIVVDAAGAHSVLDEDVEILRPCGRLVWAGLVGDGVAASLLADELVYKEIDVRGVWTKSAESFSAAIALIERDVIPFERMVTHSYSMERAEEAIRSIGGEEGERPIKAVIDPRA